MRLVARTKDERFSSSRGDGRRHARVTLDELRPPSPSVKTGALLDGQGQRLPHAAPRKSPTPDRDRHPPGGSTSSAGRNFIRLVVSRHPRAFEPLPDHAGPVLNLFATEETSSRPPIEDRRELIAAVDSISPRPPAPPRRRRRCDRHPPRCCRRPSSFFPRAGRAVPVVAPTATGGRAERGALCSSGCASTSSSWPAPPRCRRARRSNRSPFARRRHARELGYLLQRLPHDAGGRAPLETV